MKIEWREPNPRFIQGNADTLADSAARTLRESASNVSTVLPRSSSALRVKQSNAGTSSTPRSTCSPSSATLRNPFRTAPCLAVKSLARRILLRGRHWRRHVSREIRRRMFRRPDERLHLFVVSSKTLHQKIAIPTLVVTLTIH